VLAILLFSRTEVTTAFLVSAHYAFWRVVLDQRFIP
jgi:hypothetical protein